MKGFIEVYDQRTQFLKDIFLSHGYQINDKQAQTLDFYVVKNQKTRPLSFPANENCRKLPCRTIAAFR